MSISKLDKSAEHLRIRINTKLRQDNPPDTDIVVISDSKGRYLQRHEDILPDQVRVHWMCGGGANLEGTICRLRSRFDRDTRNWRNIHAYLWLGTCDLTFRDQHRKIWLYSKDNTRVEFIIQKYIEAKDLLERKGCKVTILETPYYSISRWNREKDSPTQDDKLLIAQIEELNSKIKELNTGRSPRLNLYLTKSRSGSGKKSYTNWNLLTDGIHPGLHITRVWLYSIVQHALDC